MKPEIYHLLKARGMTLTKLAAHAGVARCHLSGILRNKPGRGGVVRGKIAAELTEEELGVLGWKAKSKKQKAEI